VTIKQVGRNEFVNFKNPEPIDLKLAAQGWAEAQKILLAGNTDILILDELNIALAHNLLKTQDIVKFLQAHKGHTEVITTGRDAPKELLAIADLITDMQEVKHYYTRGVGIRDGIDH
jgi:cob(I)alamin adenosyltransferase